MRDGLVYTEVGKLQWTNAGDRFAEGTAVDLLVRPDDFLVFPDARGRCVTTSREFHGEEAILLVRLPSVATLRSRQRPDSTLPIGERVTLIPTRTAAFLAFGRGETDISRLSGDAASGPAPPPQPHTELQI